MPEKNYDPTDPYSSTSSSNVSTYGSSSKAGLSSKSNKKTSQQAANEYAGGNLGGEFDVTKKVNVQPISSKSYEAGKWGKFPEINAVDKGWGGVNTGEGFVTQPTDTSYEKGKWTKHVSEETWNKGVEDIFGGSVDTTTSDANTGQDGEDTTITDEEEKYKKLAKEAQEWFKANGKKNFGLYKTDRYGNITNKEFLDLFEATSGLIDVNQDWTMRDALNYLESGELPRLSSFSNKMKTFNKIQSEEIRDRKIKLGEEWHTFGSGLRGSFETSWVEGGLGTMTRDEYGKMLDILSGKWEINSPVWKMQQQLQDAVSASGPKPTTSGLALALLSLALPQPLGMIFNTGIQADQTRKGKAHALSDDDPKASLNDWVLNPIGGLMEKYGWKLPENGVSSIESMDGLLNLNHPLDYFASLAGKKAYWKSKVQTDDDKNEGSSLVSFSTNYTAEADPIDDTDESSQDETNTTINLDNEIPLWWDLTLYEKFIQGTFK
jgi:hypothetical protein|tara:strand:- start:179 stop:1651 length:1473 start_codon:yes stop_codon:yes gene_type:complete